LTGETLTFSEDQISQFKVYDEEGKLVLPASKTIKLEIKPEQKTVVFTFRTLDENGNELSRLENLSFNQTIKDQSAYFRLDDEKQKAISMEIVITKKVFTFTVKTEYANLDVVQLQNAINFVESCRNAKKLNILIPADGVDDTLDAPDASNIPSFNEHFRKLNDALVTIQQFSGIPFTFPTQYYQKEYNETIRLSENLKAKQVPIEGFSFTMPPDDSLDILTKYKSGEFIEQSFLKVPSEIELFQKKLNLLTTIKISDFILENNIDESIESLKKEKKDMKFTFKPKEKPTYGTYEINKSSKKES